MPNQKSEPQHHTLQSETFAARKTILLALTESQAKEHAYYAATAESVRKHMQALCSAWIALLLGRIRGGAQQMDDRFLSATGIGWDQMNAWRVTHRAHECAQTELNAAQNELAAAEKTRSGFSGVLWGAKKGFEKEYAERDNIVQKAKTNLEHERTRVVAAERALDLSSEDLLRYCIGRSALVSASAEFGVDIARVLRSMQAEGQALKQKHDDEQRQLLGTADHAFSCLTGHYRK